MSRTTSTYTRWSFNYPPEAVLPPGYVYGVSYALFGLDVLPGQIVASRAPVRTWEPGKNIYRFVHFSDEARAWFSSCETRPLLIMTAHGPTLLSKRYYIPCGLGLLIHFHAPVTRAASAACRGFLHPDWIISEEVRRRGGGRCDPDTYLVMRETTYDLTERLPFLLPQGDVPTASLRTIAAAICSFATAIGCEAQERLYNGFLPTQDVLFSDPLIWEAFLLYGLSMARTYASHDGTVSFTLNPPDALSAEPLSIRLDMDVETLRIAEPIPGLETVYRTRDRMGSLLGGYECLSAASTFNGSRVKMEVGRPRTDPDNRRLSLRHVTLSMTQKADPALSRQMSLRTNAVELFKY